jgi:plasmid maintenance system antidote protein VapI
MTGYPNLSAEMRRYGVKQEEIANGIGRTPETVSRWLTGKNPLTVEDAFKIREQFFPSMSIDYLFSEKPMTIQ